MPESNGIANSGQEVVDALDTFLTANGWAQHDTDPGNLGAATPNDTVYVSNAVAGDQVMYARVTNRAKLLDYDNQTANFVVGESVTGGTSGATGVIVFDVDAGTSGTLHLVDVVGQFADNELVTSASGSADVNGHLQYQDPPSPADIDHWYDSLVVRGYLYWDEVAHTGVGEFGRWKDENGSRPILISPDNVGGRDFYMFLPDGPSGKKQWFYAQTARLTGQNLNPTWGGEYGGGAFDGRQWWRNPDSGSLVTQFRAFDLPTYASDTKLNTGAANPQDSRSSMIVVPNKDDADYSVYAIHNSMDASTMWRRWNSVTQSWSVLAATPFGNVNMQGCTGVWDGDDRIFVIRGGGTTWAYYEISTDSWTTLAAAPASRSTAHFGQQTPVYIPAGRQPGLASGIAEDVIYISLINGTTLHRYNVASNTWSGNISLPVSLQVGESIVVWDHERYLYYFPFNNDGSVYRWDLQNPGSWVNLGDFHPTVVMDQQAGALLLDHAVGVLPTPPGTQEYFISGNADAIKVVNKISSGPGDHRYFWMYFGRIDNDGYQKVDVMTTTANTAPGAPATVTVDDTSAHAVGDEVLFVDPGTGQTERSQITAINSGTELECNLFNSFTTGTIIGYDPNPMVIASDLWQACANLDRQGFQSDGMGTIYYLRPGSDLYNHDDSTGRVMPKTGPTVRGRTQVHPYVMSWELLQTSARTNDSPSDPADPGVGDNMMFHTEVRGQLEGVFDIDTSITSRAPAPEQILSIGGDQYRVFPQDRIRRGSAVSTREGLKQHVRNTEYKWVCVGPIN